MNFFILIDPPTATAQEKKVRVVHGKPLFYDPEPVKEPVTKCTKYDLVKCLREHFPEYLDKLKDAYGKNSHVAFFWNTVNDLDRNNEEFIELAHAIGFDDTQIDEVFSLVIPTEGLK